MPQAGERRVRGLPASRRRARPGQEPAAVLDIQIHDFVAGGNDDRIRDSHSALARTPRHWPSRRETRRSGFTGRCGMSTTLPSPTRHVPMDSAQRGDGPFVWRFNMYHRLTHATVMISFFTLVTTGLPLRFSNAFWAPTLMRLLGGVHTAGRRHRLAAAVTFGYFLAHLGYVLVAIARARPADRKRMLWGRESMV